MEDRGYTFVGHEKPLSYEEGGLTVTRGSAWTGPGCHLGCGVLMYTDEDGKLVKVEGDRENPFNQGRLCARCLALPEVVNHEDRLTHPMKRAREDRGKDAWERISWDEAFDLIADKFLALREQHGPECVTFWQGTGRDIAPWITRLAWSYGSPNYTVALSGTACYAPRIAGCRVSSGAFWLGDYSQQFADRYDNPQWKVPGMILIWGNNPVVSNSDGLFGHWVTDCMKRGSKIIVVDPKRTWLASKSEVFLQLRPGTDAALAMGMLNVMITEGIYDRDFVDCWCYGFDELAERVSTFTPERVEEITWVPAAKLEEAVRIICENAPATLVSSSAGACHATNVGNFQRAVYSIIALTGDLDVAGGLAMGPGLPFDYSASTAAFRLEDMYAEKGLQDIRYDKDDFPVWAHYFKMIQTAHLPELVADGKIRAGVLLGVNSMMWPQTPEYQRAIKDMEFTVAIDYYMRPWTHDLVDMLLPAAMCYERMAPPAIFGRKIFHRDPVVKPMGQCREDWQIILEIGCALGFEEECYGGSVEAALDDMYRGAGIDISLELLREHPEGYEVPGGSKDEKKYETGGLRKDGQPGFNTPTGKIELVSEILKQYGFEGLPVYEEPVHSPVSTPDEAKDYSLVLNSGSRVPYYTHSKLRDLPWLNQFMPDPVVRLHPDDAEARGITDGAQVRVFNQFGEVTMKAEITNLVLPGVVDVFHGWHQADINLLTTRDFDPITGFPPFRSGLCEVERTGKGKITV